MDARCDIITYCITFYTLILELSRETESFFREIFGFFDRYLTETVVFPQFLTFLCPAHPCQCPENMIHY